MKALLILSLLCAACLAHPIRHELLETLKEQAEWESYHIHENPFRHMTEEEIKNFFGVKLEYDHHNINMLVDNDDHTHADELPESFDSRTQWKDCVLPIRDQQSCGSCWAFSAAEVLADRFCVASKGQIKTVLSTQDMVSCDTKDHGCNGGALAYVWNYLEQTGIVSEECFPYVSGDGKTKVHCPHGKCQDTKLKYTKYRAQKNSAKAYTCAVQIKQELMKNGPVQTGFEVYEDFMNYKSGIYKKTSGKLLGGHAVKIVGWGKENGTEFWICQNSWGSSWGENGYFRIAFGECSIDANAYAGLPNISEFQHSFLSWQ